MTDLGPYRALAYPFRLSCLGDQALERLLAELFAGLAVDGAAADAVFGIEALDDGSYLVTLPDGGSGDVAAPALLGALMGHLNRAAVASCPPGRLVVHAAGAADDAGRTVLLPAASGSGKTTLVAGLARDGWTYVSDEAVAVDPLDLSVLPYAKPLSVSAGSWETLADLGPPPSPTVAATMVERWQLAPGWLGQPTSIAAPLHIAAVVLPNYQPGGPTTLQPVRRADAAATVFEQAFHGRKDPRRWLPAIAAVLAQVPCYRLVVGDHRRSCQLVGELLARGLNS